MKIKRFLALLCAAVLLFSLSACFVQEDAPPTSENGGTTTAPPEDAATTTTAAKPDGPPDPDPVISFAEYCADGWYGGEHTNAGSTEYPDSIGQRNAHGGGYIGIYGKTFLPTEFMDAAVVASMKEGTLYCEYAGNVTALREEVGEAYTSTCYHLGYAYLALGNTVYRYRQKDGANETVVYTASDRIQALTADRYALYFLTDDGLYQLFRPTGQLKRLVENDGTQYTYLSRLSEDILLYGNNAYSLTYNRVFDWDSLVDAYTAKQDTLEIQGFPMTDDFKAWLKEYCAKNPA